MYFVRTDADYLVLVGVWSSRKKALELHGLPSNVLFSSQAWNISVSHTQQAIFLNLGKHEPVISVEDEARISPVVRSHVIVNLQFVSLRCEEVQGSASLRTFVATICSSHVRPGNSISPNRDLLI